MVDIEKNPKDFLLKLSGVVSHSVLSLTTLKYSSMLTQYDPTCQQEDLGLRDLIYIMLTARQIIDHLDDKGFAETCAADLMMIPFEDVPHNILLRNYSMLVTKSFFSAIMSVKGT